MPQPFNNEEQNMHSKIHTNRRPLGKAEAARVIAAPFPKRAQPRFWAIAPASASELVLVALTLAIGATGLVMMFARIGG